MNKIVDTEVARLKMDDGVVMQLGSKMYSQSVWWVVLRELIQNGLDAGATQNFDRSRLMTSLIKSILSSIMTPYL